MPETENEEFEHRLALVFSTAQPELVKALASDIGQQATDAACDCQVSTTAFEIVLTSANLQVSLLRRLFIECLEKFQEPIIQSGATVTLRDEIFRDVANLTFYLNHNELQTLVALKASVTIRLAHINRRHHLHSSKRNRPILCEIDSACHVPSLADCPTRPDRPRLYWQTETAAEMRETREHTNERRQRTGMPPLPMENIHGKYLHQFLEPMRYTNRRLENLLLHWVHHLKREIPLLPDRDPASRPELVFGAFLLFPSSNSFQVTLSKETLHSLLSIHPDSLRFCIYFCSSLRFIP